VAGAHVAWSHREELGQGDEAYLGGMYEGRPRLPRAQAQGQREGDRDRDRPRRREARDDNNKEEVRTEGDDLCMCLIVGGGYRRAGSLSVDRHLGPDQGYDVTWRLLAAVVLGCACVRGDGPLCWRGIAG
jgi:hypothetical protein